MPSRSWLLRTTVTIVPLALFGAWSFSYIRMCVLTLAAPGVPVVLKLATPSGDISFRADSYDASLRDGQIHLSRPSLFDPSGRLLASAGSVLVSGIKIVRGANQVLNINANDVYGRLTRLKNGRFQIQDLIPKQTSTTSGLAYEIQVHKAAFDVIDESGSAPYTLKLTSSDTMIAGRGADWVANGSAVIQGAGTVRASLDRAVASGLEVKVSTTDLELSKVWSHIKDAPELRRLGLLSQVQVGSLRVSGPARVFIANKGTVAVESRIAAVARNVRYQGVSADQTRFEGIVNNQGAEGKVSLSTSKLGLEATGSVSWKDGGRAYAYVTGLVADESAVPPSQRKLLPPSLRFRSGSYAGWISYSRAQQLRVVGDAQVSELGYRGQNVQNITAHLDGGPDLVLMRLGNVLIHGQAISAVAQIQPKQRQIIAEVDSKKIDLTRLSQEFHVPGIKANGTANILVTGPLSGPLVAFRADASGEYQSPSSVSVAGKIEAEGTYKVPVGSNLTKGALRIDRAAVLSRAGGLYIMGSSNPDQSLSFDVIGRDLKPGAYLPKVTGVANLQGHVSGTVVDPFLRGRVEAYSLTIENHELPLLTTEVALDRHRLQLEDIRAIKGTAQGSGNVTLTLANRNLNGLVKVSAIQIADIMDAAGVPDQGFIGILDAPAIQIGGTLSHPVVAGQMTGTSLLANGVKVDDLKIQAAYDGVDTVNGSASATVANGSLNASGAYHVRSRTTQVTADAKAVNMGVISDVLASDSTVTGTIDGHATAELEGSKLRVANASGRLASVVVNGSAIGSGSWSVVGNPDALVGNLDLGQLDRYVTLHDVSYVYAKQVPTISGLLEMANFPLQDIIGSSLRYFPNLSYDASSTLSSIQGSLDASIAVSGAAKNPAVACNTFEASSLTIRGEKLGTLSLEGRHGDGVWSLTSLSLMGGPGTLTLSGSANEAGDLKLDGDLTNLDLSRLGALRPELAAYTGKLSSSFTVTGPYQDPSIVASLSATGLFADQTSGIEDRSLRVELAPLTISETSTQSGVVRGGIQAAGTYFYRGFVGQLSATLPFKYPFQIPEDGQISASLSINDRSVAEIARALGGIDAARSTGKLGGALTAKGTQSDIRLVGEMHLDAPTLAISGSDTTLRQVTANAKLDGDTISLSASATSDRGGDAKVELATLPGQVSSFITRMREGGSRPILATRISGTLDFTNFKAHQTFPGKTYVDGTAKGSISFLGSLRRPAISGAIALSGVDTVVPTPSAQAAESPTFAVDPTFDIRASISDPAHVRASGADLMLIGGGSLKGSLSQPQLRADLSVDKGQLRLPAALIRLEPGGTVALDYQSTSSSALTRLNVNLLGQTQITTNTPGGSSLQRYDITVGVIGDLLSNDALNLTASSDPPDLTQDRIFALLGQTDLLESLNAGSGVSRGTAQRQFQGALVGMALPSVFGSITSSVAKSLGLDYIELDYSQFEQASVSFAKSVGPAFTVQGTRQVNQPQPGYPFQYDYRLVYRPRGVPGFLQRVSLSLGTDQDNPYKFGLEYGTRF